MKLREPIDAGPIILTGPPTPSRKFGKIENIEFQFFLAKDGFRWKLEKYSVEYFRTSRV